MKHICRLITDNYNERGNISNKNIKSLRQLIVVILLTLLITPANLKSQWERMFGFYTTSLATGSDGVIFATDLFNYGINRSTNSGVNWSRVGNIPDPYVVYSSGSTLFAGPYSNTGSGEGIHRSTDNGLTWMQVNSGLASYIPRAFLRKDKYFFAALNDDDVYRSSNNGSDWIPLNVGLLNVDLYDLEVMGKNIFLSTTDRVYRSSNDGINWTYSNLPRSPIYSLEIMDSVLFAGTGSGVFKSSDAGESWAQSSIGFNYRINILFALDSILFAGTSPGFYRSTDKGVTWTPFDQGLDSAEILGLTVDNMYMYAGGLYNGISRRPINELLVSVQNISAEIPEKYELEQNFPNPFNPETNLEFGISKLGFVSLKIYDLLGKEVASLVNESLNPGKYKYKFKAEDLASGIYFYKLEVDGNAVDAKRMTLLK